MLPSGNKEAAQPCQSQLALDCPSTLLKVPAVLSSTDHPVHQNEQLNVFFFAEIAENKKIVDCIVERYSEHRLLCHRPARGPHIEVSKHFARRIPDDKLHIAALDMPKVCVSQQRQNRDSHGWVYVVVSVKFLLCFLEILEIVIGSRHPFCPNNPGSIEATRCFHERSIRDHCRHGVLAQSVTQLLPTVLSCILEVIVPDLLYGS